MSDLQIPEALEKENLTYLRLKMEPSNVPQDDLRELMVFLKLQLNLEQNFHQSTMCLISQDQLYKRFDQFYLNLYHLMLFEKCVLFFDNGLLRLAQVSHRHILSEVLFVKKLPRPLSLLKNQKVLLLFRRKMFQCLV